MTKIIDLVNMRDQRIDRRARGPIDAAVDSAIDLQRQKEAFLLQHATCLETIQSLTAAGRSVKAYLDHTVRLVGGILCQYADHLGVKREGFAVHLTKASLEGSLGQDDLIVQFHRNPEDGTIIIELTREPNNGSQDATPDETA